MAKRTLSLVLLIVGALAASLGARGETEEAPSPPSPPKEPGYVGDRVCMRCHFAQHKSWASTAHARATRVLLPGQAAAKKAAADLDPRKDYTKDPDCLQCHTTGYGEPGGYPAPPSSGGWSREERFRASRTASVACEACHGAGGRFTVVMDKNPRFRREEIVAAGAQIPRAERGLYRLSRKALCRGR